MAGYTIFEKYRELMETPEEERLVSAHFKEANTYTWPEAMRTALNNKVSAAKEHTDHVTQSKLIAASILWLYMSDLSEEDMDELVMSYRKTRSGDILPDADDADTRLFDAIHRSISTEMPEPVVGMVGAFYEAAQATKAKRKEITAIAFYGVLMAGFEDEELAGLVESYEAATMAEIFPERFEKAAA
jgi:hypothetical protein